MDKLRQLRYHGIRWFPPQSLWQIALWEWWISFISILLVDDISLHTSRRLDTLYFRLLYYSVCTTNFSSWWTAGPPQYNNMQNRMEIKKTDTQSPVKMVDSVFGIQFIMQTVTVITQNIIYTKIMTLTIIFHQWLGWYQGPSEMSLSKLGYLLDKCVIHEFRVKCTNN